MGKLPRHPSKCTEKCMTLFMKEEMRIRINEYSDTLNVLKYEEKIDTHGQEYYEFTIKITNGEITRKIFKSGVVVM